MGSNFTFIGEYEGEVKRALAKYPEDRKQSAVLPLLDLAQRQIGGYVSDEAILNNMRSGDYTNLVKTFDKYFGEYVILETRDTELLEDA